MKPFSIRSAASSDSPTYIDWLRQAADINLVDFGVYQYPTCNTVVIEKDGDPVLMNSFHLVMVQEALAPKPGVSPKDEARALRTLYAGLRKVATATGVREIWFTCADPRLEKFVLAKGWKKVTTPVFRMVLGGEDDPLNSPRPEGRTTESLSREF